MQKVSSEIVEKENRIKNWLKSKPGVIVAFSGGVDSALLLFIARKVLGKEKSIGVIAKSSSLKEKDYRMAVDFSKKYDINLITDYTRELDNPDYFNNSHLRCYFCKTEIYNELKNITKGYPGFVIINGNNIDDQSDYRPGNNAALENNVFSPFIEAGLSKYDIRTIAKKYNLPVWDKPASPCLSSRFPYGHKITYYKLKQVEAAEEVLENYGFKEVRVRHYNDYCKIEVPADLIPKLESTFDVVSSEIKKKANFEKVLLDAEGLVSGKMNRALLEKVV